MKTVRSSAVTAQNIPVHRNISSPSPWNACCPQQNRNTACQQLAFHDSDRRINCHNTRPNTQSIKPATPSTRQCSHTPQIHSQKPTHSAGKSDRRQSGKGYVAILKHIPLTSPWDDHHNQAIPYTIIYNFVKIMAIFFPFGIVNNLFAPQWVKLAERTPIHRPTNEARRQRKTSLRRKIRSRMYALGFHLRDQQIGVVSPTGIDCMHAVVVWSTPGAVSRGIGTIIKSRHCEQQCLSLMPAHRGWPEFDLHWYDLPLLKFFLGAVVVIRPLKSRFFSIQPTVRDTQPPVWPGILVETGVVVGNAAVG